MICDLADVATRQDDEEGKHSTNLAPTPSAAHNPNSDKTSNRGEFEATKMSKISKEKYAREISKMVNAT